jgi:hypothetical protein
MRFEVAFPGPEGRISNPFSKAAKAGYAPKDSKFIVLDLGPEAADVRAARHRRAAGDILSTWF